MLVSVTRIKIEWHNDEVLNECCSELWILHMQVRCVCLSVSSIPQVQRVTSDEVHEDRFIRTETKIEE